LQTGEEIKISVKKQTDTGSVSQGRKKQGDILKGAGPEAVYKNRGNMNEEDARAFYEDYIGNRNIGSDQDITTGGRENDGTGKTTEPIKPQENDFEGKYDIYSQQKKESGDLLHRLIENLTTNEVL
jgi:hypothetical protein